MGGPSKLDFEKMAMANERYLRKPAEVDWEKENALDLGSMTIEPVQTTETKKEN